jgi:hypothetical protein
MWGGRKRLAFTQNSSWVQPDSDMVGGLVRGHHFRYHVRRFDDRQKGVDWSVIEVLPISFLQQSERW